MKKIISALILLTIYILPAFSLSDESRADLRRIADWWEAREDKLNERLGELERENPDPSNPNDKTWQEYLKVLDEIKTADAKQKLYRETARFDYTRSIIKDTVQVYRPAADFMEFTFERGVELVNALISQSWQDLVKISVDSVLRTRIRAKIRSELGCSETVPGLENWLVIMGFGEDPWSTTVDQAVLNWAKGDAQSKAMLLSLQAEKGRQIYKDYLKKPQLVSAAANAGGNPLQWLEDKTKASGEKVMDALGLATFVSDIGGRLWISFEMDDSINDTLKNLKILREKYKEKDIDLSCEDLFLVWSKQKTINLEDPEEIARLEKLKTGLEFFKKKIPGWYQSKTVPDHFQEIVRMIPIAEELGEYDTAENLRDILVEFGYKEMTPEEIAAAEKQSLIDENRKYLISHLKGLRNLLVHKNYDEVDSEWEITKGTWEDLIELGYNTDTDKEIQNLWKEIEPMLKQNYTVPDSIQDNTVNTIVLNFAEEARSFVKYMRSGNYNKAKSSFIKIDWMMDSINQDTLTSGEKTMVEEATKSMKEAFREKNMDKYDLESYNSFAGNPHGDEYKRQILEFVRALISAYRNKDKARQDRINTETEKYMEKAEKSWGLIYNDTLYDKKYIAELGRLEVILDKLISEDDTSEESGPVSPPTSNYNGPGTPNTSF